MTDKHRHVRGKAVKKADIPAWPAEKIPAFIVFSMFFIKMGDKDGTQRLVFSIDINRIEEAKTSELPYFGEFMARMYKKNMKLSEFRMKILNAIKSVTEYIQENPHVLTPQIEQLVTGNFYWERCLNAFSEEKNEAGGTNIVVGSETSTLAEMKTPLAQYHQGLLKMSSVFNSLLKGINQKDINEMSVDKRLRIANNLLHSLSKAVTAQNNTKVFNTIVVNKGGREDLEKSILEYSESQNITEQ